MPFNVDALGYAIQPHGHYLMREVKVTVTTPGGKPLPLLEIKDWDFNWQDRYVFAKRLPLPKGTRVDLVAYFDNSAENRQNPNNPPRRVRWGTQSTDEMLGMLIQICAGNIGTATQSLTIDTIPPALALAGGGGGPYPK